MDLFRRKISLSAGKIFEPPLTIYFDIPFDDSEDVNEAVITIYNLSQNSIAGIKTDSPVSLVAGYENDFGLIFQGVAKNVETTWQGVDKITEISCNDDNREYLKAKVNETFAPGTTVSTVLKFLIGKAKLGIGDFSPVRNFTYRNGKTVKGDVSKHLKAVVKDTHSKMHIHRGRIYIRASGKGDPTGFVVNKDSGLIGNPEKIESEEETKDKGEKKKRSGWKIVTLLNHKVTVDSYIILQSKTVNGQFRVAKGRHFCDGNSFYTETEVY